MGKKRSNPHEDPRYIDVTHETRANMLAGLRNIESVKGHKAMRTMNRCLASLDFTREEREEATGQNWQTETTRLKFSKATIQDLLTYNEEIPWTGAGAEKLFPFIEAMDHAKEAIPGDPCFLEDAPKEEDLEEEEDDTSSNGETLATEAVSA